MMNFADERIQRLVDDLTTLTLVDIAESLDGKAPPSKLVTRFAQERDVKFRTPGDVVKGFLRHDGKLDRRQAVEQLLSRDPETGAALSRAEMSRIRKMYHPGSGINVLDRTSVVEQLAPLLAPPKPIKKGDVKEWNGYFVKLVAGSFRPFQALDPAPQSGSGGGSTGGSTGGAPGVPTFNFLRFMVRDVICDDDTRESGQDEIHFGGTGARGTITDDLPDPASHDVAAFPMTDAGQFRTGDTRTYNPPRQMVSFNLNAGQMPQLFLAHFALAEVDNGGFADFLQELYVAVTVQITAVLTAVGAAIGAAIGAGATAGGLAGSVAGPIGTLIGVAAGVIVSAIVAGIASLMRDDIFGVQTAELIMHSAFDNFNGSNTGPLETFTFSGFGGSYRVRYFWQLS